MLLKPMGLMRAVVAAGGGGPEFGEVGTAVVGSSTGGTTIVSTLANVAAGDLILAVVAVAYNVSNPPVITDTSTNTYTRVAFVSEASSSGDEFRCGLYAAIAGASSASLTITCTLNDSRLWRSIVSARWSGVSSATPNASFAPTALVGSNLTSRTTATAVTPSVASLVIAAGTDWNNAANHTAANGFTKRFDGNVTSGSALWIHERIVEASTSSGGGTSFATAQSDSYMPMLCAFTADE